MLPEQLDDFLFIGAGLGTIDIRGRPKIEVVYGLLTDQIVLEIAGPQGVAWQPALLALDNRASQLALRIVAGTEHATPGSSRCASRAAYSVMTAGRRAAPRSPAALLLEIKAFRGDGCKLL